MDTHDPQYYEAQRILNELPTDISTQLFKTTRAGATTGLCAVAIDAGIKFTLIAPKIAIATNTLDESKPYTKFNVYDIDTPNIPGNRACARIDDEIKKCRDLEHLPMIPLPMKCDGCIHYEECPVTEFLRADNPVGVGLTHQKLNALMHSSSDTAQAVVDKLMTMGELVIIDEAHELETNNAATVQVYPYPEMDKYDEVLDKYTILREIVLDFNTIIRDNDETIIHNLLGARDKSDSMHMMMKVYGDGEDSEYEPKDFRLIVSAIKNIVDIMKHRSKYDLSLKDVVYLSDIIMTMSGHQLVMHYIMDDGKEYIHLSSPGGLRNAVRNYVSQLIISGKSRIVFTTATFGEFYYGNMFGINIHQTIMKDTCNTNDIMTIYPDTYRLSTYNYWREQGNGKKFEMMDEIIAYHTMYPNIRFVCMKMSVARDIHRWALEMGYKINTDYYRSTKSEGVKYDGREIVCVGAPVTSINAHDGVCTSFEESQITRISNEHASWWQAVSRAKDPKGITPSTIFCIGITEDVVRNMCVWGVNRKIATDESGLYCESVSVDDGYNGVGIPHIVSIKTIQLVEIMKKLIKVDRVYLMQRLNVRAAELDTLLADDYIADHIKVIKTPTKRKPKTSYKWVE